MDFIILDNKIKRIKIRQLVVFKRGSIVPKEEEEHLVLNNSVCVPQPSE